MCYDYDDDDEFEDACLIDCPEDGDPATFDDNGIHCSNEDCIYYDPD